VSKAIIRHIIREETDSQNRRIKYGKIGQAVFNRQLEKLSIGIDPRYEHHKARIKQVYNEYIQFYTGKHIRDMVYYIDSKLTLQRFSDFSVNEYLLTFW
jgi:hypothetical protein